MAAFYEWVRNIVICLLVISLIYQLLPDSDYKKYMRVSAGLVLIVVVMTPLLKLFGEEFHLSYFFELETLRAELETISCPDELYAADTQRRKKVTESYKAQLEAEAEALFEKEPIGLFEVDITIETDESSQSFGRVTAVYGRAAAREDIQNENGTIDPIIIGEDCMEKGGDSTDSQGTDKSVRGDLDSGSYVPAEYAGDVAKMRQKLADYLCTDVSAVTIVMNTGGGR